MNIPKVGHDLHAFASTSRTTSLNTSTNIDAYLDVRIACSLHWLASTYLTSLTCQCCTFFCRNSLFTYLHRLPGFLDANQYASLMQTLLKDNSAIY